MTNRHRGDYFERQTRDALMALGWVVIRAAGSLGPADLVAMRGGDRPLLISCKLNGRIDPHERLELISAAWAAGGRGLLAWRSKPGYVELLAVHKKPGRGEPVDVIKVPPRRKAEPL